MYRLSLIISCQLLLAFGMQAQNPHGKEFRMDCAQCHNSGSWSYNPESKFRHESTRFALEGQHKTIECKACHTNLIFKKTSSSCISCHSDMHNQTVGNDCARCHTSQTWIVEDITKIHDKTSFPLVGVHKTVNCNQCHISSTKLQYSPLGQTCIECHKSDFTEAKSPNHTKLNLSNDCAFCHNTTVQDWKTRKFPDHNAVYPLTGAHANIAQECEKCHKGSDYSSAPLECAGCHQSNFNEALNPNHQKLNLSTDCATCHTTNPGWATATFAIHDQYYPLTGAHKSIENDCAQCHKGGNYDPIPNDCNACHNDNYAKTINPNHESLGMSNECASCHSTNPGWIPAKFIQHNQFYPLIGGHSTLQCKQCHQNGTFNNTQKDCNACHNQTFQKTANPNHLAIGLSTDCATCHTQNPGWKPSTFNHDVYYPLTGAHASVADNCSACHKTGNIKDAPTDCNGCHNAAFTATINPNHSQIGLSTDCATCHTTNPGWKPTTFNHDVYYPLTGAHASTASNCTACHKTGNIKGAPTDCNGCHNAAFTATINPNHSQIGLSTDCATCHTTNPGWKPTTFNHNVYYPLTRAHASVAENCSACHKTGNIKDTPTDCKGCHNADFNAAQNPNHSQIGLSTDCATCHTTNPGWKPTTFNHNVYYPLTRAHASVAENCSACHKTGNIKDTPTDCKGCHNADFNAAQNPNHTSNGFSTDCASCHTTNPNWEPAKFPQHDAFFPITGAHTSLTCIQCHKNGNYANTPNTCNGCHNDAFTANKNPNHASNGFPTDCASCHTTNPGWRPSTFNHNNYYPLTGAHAITTCVACHKNGVYKNTPTDCNACHNAAYQSAQNPNHASNGFSTDCASCHTTNPGWRPSTFNHNNYYPLTGAHATTTCVACHKNGVYKNTPTDCNACHNPAYQSAQNPNHASNGFSTDCASCHTTNPSWRPSTFNHNNYYPLTGAHATTTCVACHKNGVYKNTPTDCNACHNPAFNSAANPNHKTVGLNTDCASCHTTNPGWRPTSFIHVWPLQGAHAAIAKNCTSCHNTGNASAAPTTCYGCHATDYNTATPNHASTGFSTNCTSCHSQNSWSPSTWNHDAQYFPIYSGKHKGEWTNCNECHTSTGNFSVFNCLNCHKKASTDADHRGEKGYSYTSLACFSCHPRGR